MRKGIVLCLVLALAGCSSLGGRVRTSFSESVTEDGQTTVTTSYTADSRAGMFGQLDTSNHEFKYDWEGNSIATGQNAQGQDNTGNQAMLTMLTEILKMAIEQVSAVQAQQIALRAAMAEAQAAGDGAQSDAWMAVLAKLLAAEP